MILAQSALLFLLGLVMLLVNYDGFRKGWLPCGSNWLKGRLKIHRVTHPLIFWLLFLMYGVFGFGLIIFSLRLLSGQAEPLPLR